MTARIQACTVKPNSAHFRILSPDSLTSPKFAIQLAGGLTKGADKVLALARWSRDDSRLIGLVHPCLGDNDCGRAGFCSEAAGGMCFIGTNIIPLYDCPEPLRGK